MSERFRMTGFEADAQHHQTRRLSDMRKAFAIVVYRATPVVGASSRDGAFAGRSVFRIPALAGRLSFSQGHSNQLRSFHGFNHGTGGGARCAKILGEIRQNVKRRAT